MGQADGGVLGSESDHIFYHMPTEDGTIGAAAGLAAHTPPASKGRILTELSGPDEADITGFIIAGFGTAAPAVDVSLGGPVQNFMNAILRPLLPSELSAPSSRHEIFWKPTLGVFDLDYNLPPTSHVLPAGRG